MASFDDIILFGTTSLSDLFKQIHRNNKDTDKQINGLIDALTPLASSNAGSAVMLMPTVKDLIDVNVKNNDQLIKIAGIAQRSTNSNNTSMELFNPDEIAQLIEEQRAIQIEGNKLLEKTETIQHQIEHK
jgi:hypothetical protein